MPVDEGEIKSDFITGDVKATVMKDATHDVILGCKFITLCKIPVASDIVATTGSMETYDDVMPMTDTLILEDSGFDKVEDRSKTEHFIAHDLKVELEER